MKRTYHLFIFLFAVVYGTISFALTPDEKISEMQKVFKIDYFDWNGDGKKDIIAGAYYSGRIYVYLNTGTNKEPIFNNRMKIHGVTVSRSSKSHRVVDWNNDGKKDLIIGSSSGEVSLFINKGINLNQQIIFGKEIKLNDGDLSVGSFSSPAIVDWNGDGKKDLIVGNRTGNVYVFLNVAEDYAPAFDSKGIKTDISVDGYATPFITDWNNDGKFDVLCSSSDGRVYIFINEGNSKNPKFGKPQTLQTNNKEIKLLSQTSVIALDWDDDGKIDLLVSNEATVNKDISTGQENTIPFGIYLLLNTGTKEKPEFKELKPLKGKFWDDTVL